MQSLHLGSRNRNVVNFTFYNNFLDFPQIELHEGVKIFRVRKAVAGPIFLDNGSQGNYWCDYNGTDNDGDGIGDTPYVIYTNDILNHHSPPRIADVADMVLIDHFPLMSPPLMSALEVTIPSFPTQTPTPEPTDEPESFSPILTLGVVVLIVIAGLGIFAYLVKKWED